MDVEVTQIERGPTVTCQRAGISSARSTASGRALVRGVPSAEEPTESAAKERQCVRHHRSKEHEESAKTYESNRQERLAWSGGRAEEDLTTPARKTAGENIGWVKGAP